MGGPGTRELRVWALTGRRAGDFRRRGGFRAWSRLYQNSPPLPSVNLRFSFASAPFQSLLRMPPPPLLQPLDRSTLPRQNGSGLQNLDSTSSKSSSKPFAILSRYVSPPPVTRGNARTRRARPQLCPPVRMRAPSRGGPGVREDFALTALVQKGAVGRRGLVAQGSSQGRRSELFLPERRQDTWLFVVPGCLTHFGPIFPFWL